MLQFSKMEDGLNFKIFNMILQFTRNFVLNYKNSDFQSIFNKLKINYVYKQIKNRNFENLIQTFL